MFVKFHERLKNSEKGFTLIELLVVILIIAILAAIAIPVFLNQRKKGWKAQSESFLKDAATAEESYATGSNGSYTALMSDLQGEGFNLPAASTGLTITVATANSGTEFCLTAVHLKFGTDTGDDPRQTMVYSSKEGVPKEDETTCP